jgi:hypothetical protein
MTVFTTTDRRQPGDVASARRALYEAALAYAESAHERNAVQTRYDDGQSSRDELHDVNMLAVAQGLRLERRAHEFHATLGRVAPSPAA